MTQFADKYWALRCSPGSPWSPASLSPLMLTAPLSPARISGGRGCSAPDWPLTSEAARLVLCCGEYEAAVLS